MNPNVIELTCLEPKQLDRFLALGWFRMQQTIFTTKFLYVDDEEYEVIWLRIRLHDMAPDKKYKVWAKKNKCFRSEIKSAVITPAHEELYNSYKECISFEGASSLHALLNGQNECNVYNTQMINLYDGELLIGTGVFDLGENSAAGICSIYHPAYKKFSLGKYMIYEKMQYCKRKHFAYFYPGYYVPGYPAFDYKLEMGKPAIEYFDPEQRKWYPLAEHDHKLDP